MDELKVYYRYKRIPKDVVIPEGATARWVLKNAQLHSRNNKQFSAGHFGGVTECLLVNDAGEVEHVGFSVCVPSDVFCYANGRGLAKARAIGLEKPIGLEIEQF